MLPDDHFTRAIGGGKSGAESGADVAQKVAQQGFVTRTRLVANSSLSTNQVGVCADSCESEELGAKAQSGEGGIPRRAFCKPLCQLGLCL